MSRKLTRGMRCSNTGLTHMGEALRITMKRRLEILEPTKYEPLIEAPEGCFMCERYRCSLTIVACIKRQKTTIRGRAMNNAAMSVDPYCASGNCEQGRDNAAKMPEVKGSKILGGIGRRRR